MTHQVFRFDVDAEGDVRVDKYLSEQLPQVSRSQIKRLIDGGNVTLDGFPVEKAGTKAKPGSVVEIVVVEEQGDGLIPENIPLDIIYEDEDVLVINKASGMVVHTGAGNPTGTLVNALLSYYPPIREVGETDRPGVVHRLDKDTSGVIIFAKTNKGYRWLVKAFKAREVNKTYLALVDGHPPTPTGRIEAPIERDAKSRTRMTVGLRGQGKLAISEYFQLESFPQHALLEVHPITGRTHQIRVHLSYIGVPVAGDTLYGRKRSSIKLGRIFLHAKTLSLRLPDDRNPRSFSAPLPQDLQQILSDLENQ